MLKRLRNYFKNIQYNSDGIELDVDAYGHGLARDYFTEVKMGNITGHRLIRKFGRNDAVGTSPTLVASSGVYPTPITNTTLEIVSDSANDATGGGGATKVIIQGLVESVGVWSAQEEEVTMNGLTAVALSKSYIRVFRMWISESEAYADPTTVSSDGTLTLQETGAGAKWCEIVEFVTGNSAGQTQTAFYTTPSNTKGMLYTPQFSIDSTKVGNISVFHRPNADDVTTPYTGARRIIHQWDGVAAPVNGGNMMPYHAFDGATDFGVMASVTVGTGSVSAEFWVLEIDK